MKDKEILKCEGDCHLDGEHILPVVPVEVSGLGWKPTKFNYCQAAIKEDKRRGFTVKTKKV